MNDFQNIVFDSAWFTKHQRILLTLLNSHLSRRWFRHCLRILPTDCKLSERIAEIGPSHFKVFVKRTRRRIYLRADFRTHDKYAKRLYYAFRLVWFAMHFWDWLFADRVAPRLSFGFLTLTVFPAAGHAGTTTDDELSRQGVNETFSTIRTSAGNTVGGDITPIIAAGLRATATTNQFSVMWFSGFTFDTSPLGATATVSAAIFSLYANVSSSAGLGTINMALIGFTPANAGSFANGDYLQRVYTRQASDITITASQYNDWTMNGTGIAGVSLTGITKLATTTSWDMDNSAPSWISGLDSYQYVESADHAGTTQDPKLVVTYSVVTPALEWSHAQSQPTSHWSPSIATY